MSDVSEFYRSNSDVDFLGYDLEQDTRWEDVDPSGFYPDESLDEWPRPYRSVSRPAVCREDFDPAGLPDLLPTGIVDPGVVPGPTVRRADSPSDVAGCTAGGVPSS